MSKILFGKNLNELYKKLDETEQRLVSKRLEVEYLKKQIDDIRGAKDCIESNYCRYCKNSYQIATPMMPIGNVTYGCKLKIPCKKFDGGK